MVVGELEVSAVQSAAGPQVTGPGLWKGSSVVMAMMRQMEAVRLVAGRGRPVMVEA